MSRRVFVSRLAHRCLGARDYADGCLHRPDCSSKGCVKMTKGPVDQETKARHRVVKAQGSRSRAARPPDYQMPLIIPLWLFTDKDVRRLSAEAAQRNPALQLRQASDVETIRIAQHLHHAFDWAVQCDKMQEWEGEPQRRRRWYEQVARQADGLLKALSLSPEECKDPTKEWKRTSIPVAIHEFRQSLDRMVGARPDLPDQLDAFSRVAWDEDGSKLEGNGLDAEGHCQYRERASFLIDRLPRTVALVSLVARWQLEQLERRPRGYASQTDLFGRELFKLLAGAHGAIYKSKPLTRIKSGETIGGSIDWARAVIRHAAHAIDASPYPAPFRANGDAETSAAPAAQEAQYVAQARTMAAPYVARLRELIGLSDRRFADLLDRGWRDWKKQVASAAR